jgi:2-iminoacetate synthase ThiH
MQELKQKEKLLEWVKSNQNKWIDAITLANELGIKKTSTYALINFVGKYTLELIIDKRDENGTRLYSFSLKQTTSNNGVVDVQLPPMTLDKSTAIDLFRQFAILLDNMNKNMEENLRLINKRLDKIEARKEVEFSRSIMVLQEEILERLPR